LLLHSPPETCEIRTKFGGTFPTARLLWFRHPATSKDLFVTTVRHAAYQEVVALLEPFRRQEAPITRATDITADLDLDSLAVMNLLMQIEDKFDISIPLNLIPEIRTVGDLEKIIEQLTEGA
jgi:acyl carrier protein